jgi:hypothetical protein
VGCHGAEISGYQGRRRSVPFRFGAGFAIGCIVAVVQAFIVRGDSPQ